MRQKSNDMALWACLSMVGLTLGLAACVPASAPPPAAPPPAPVPVVVPEAPAVSSAWQDAPMTPGNWTYARATGGSIATFSSPSSGAPLSIRCDTASGRLVLARVGMPPAGVQPALSIGTSYGSATVPATIRSGAQPAVEVARAANDPLFDQIAFSRGRFMIEAAGLPRIIAPPWAEITRVIEDCRG